MQKTPYRGLCLIFATSSAILILSNEAIGVTSLRFKKTRLNMNYTTKAQSALYIPNLSFSPTLGIETCCAVVSFALRHEGVGSCE